MIVYCVFISYILLLQVNEEFCSRLRHEISRFVQRLEREYNEGAIDYRDYTVYTGTAGWLILTSS